MQMHVGAEKPVSALLVKGWHLGNGEELTNDANLGSLVSIPRLPIVIIFWIGGNERKGYRVLGKTEFGMGYYCAQSPALHIRGHSIGASYDNVDIISKRRKFKLGHSSALLY